MLLNCAGIREFATIEDVQPVQMLNSYKINAMGPIFTVQALLRHKLLQQGALIANVTSLVRCINQSCVLDVHWSAFGLVGCRAACRACTLCTTPVSQCAGSCRTCSLMCMD